MALPYEAQFFPCTPEAEAAGHCQDGSDGFGKQVKKEYVKQYYPNAEIAASTPVQQEIETQTQSATQSPPPTSEYYVYKKESQTTYPISQAKNLFGGNLDVVSTLDKIEFEQYGDGSLRNSIAYIVPWRRGGASNKTQALPSFAEAFGRDNFLYDLENSFGIPLTDPDWNLNYDPAGSPELPYNLNESVPLWDGEGGEWFTGDLNISENIEVIDQKGKVNSTIDVEDRQKKLGSELPIGVRQGILAGGQLLTDYLTKDNLQAGKYIETGLNQAAKLLDTPSGPVYVGNASGVINQALNYASMFGFNIPGRGLITSVKPDLQSSSSKWDGMDGTGGAAGLPDGAWQFLFNPSELALSVGPKYKESNTWGVMGDANGGQPLHWTNNKNPELKFNRVLLNGYVFGRQVESLEQGLMDLFMKDPSGNSHGPQVLEFVWGQRSFGPCVIKDIQINEKMWDNGLLVNADVNFTLVKVPEWTINDGQVSVYDATSFDPVAPPEVAPGPTGVGSTVPPDSKEKTAAPPDLGVGEEAVYTQRECDTGKYTAKNFDTLAKDPRLSPSLWSNIWGSDDAAAISAINKYVTIYNSYGSVINTLSGLDPICKNKCSYRGQAAPTNNTLIGCAKACSKQISQLLNKRYSGNKCPSNTLLGA